MVDLESQGTDPQTKQGVFLEQLQELCSVSFLTEPLTHSHSLVT